MSSTARQIKRQQFERGTGTSLPPHKTRLEKVVRDSHLDAMGFRVHLQLPLSVIMRENGS